MVFLFFFVCMLMFFDVFVIVLGSIFVFVMNWMFFFLRRFFIFFEMFWFLVGNMWFVYLIIVIFMLKLWSIDVYLILIMLLLMMMIDFGSFFIWRVLFEVNICLLFVLRFGSIFGFDFVVMMICFGISMLFFLLFFCLIEIVFGSGEKIDGLRIWLYLLYMLIFFFFIKWFILVVSLFIIVCLCCCIFLKLRDMLVVFILNWLVLWVVWYIFVFLSSVLFGI